jgi:hypothetical protein
MGYPLPAPTLGTPTACAGGAAARQSQQRRHGRARASSQRRRQPETPSASSYQIPTMLPPCQGLTQTLATRGLDAGEGCGSGPRRSVTGGCGETRCTSMRRVSTLIGAVTTAATGGDMPRKRYQDLTCVEAV